MKNYVHIDPPTFNEDQAFIDAIYFRLSTYAHQNEEICFQLETYNTEISYIDGYSFISFNPEGHNQVLLITQLK